MKNKTKSPAGTKRAELEIELTFEGDRAHSPWYDPRLEGVLCALCGRNCKDRSLCYNANPYCG